jgi:hypothetical protein
MSETPTKKTAELVEGERPRKLVKNIPLVSASSNYDFDNLEMPNTYPEYLARVRELNGFEHSTNAMSSWLRGKFASVAASKKEWGDGVVAKLAEDLKMSRSLLYDMRRFYDAYPTVQAVASMRNIPWSGIRMLLSVGDAEQRDALAERARASDMTTEEIKALVDMHKAPPEEDENDAEEAEAPEVPEDDFTDEASRYFNRLDTLLETFQNGITDICNTLPEMKQLAKDEDRTSEDDHEEITNLGQDISVKARAISEYLNVNLYGLNRADAFADTEED